MEFPINEQKWNSMVTKPVCKPLDNMTFKTVFPDSTPDMEAWGSKFNDNYEGWKQALNVSIAYSRFDSVKEYLKKKLFKIKGAVELENAKERMPW